MRQFRQHLAVGQDYRSDDGRVEGVIVAYWPTESGSEAIIKIASTHDEIRVFVPAKPTPV